MQNVHDTDFHILHPTDNGIISHAKLMQVHPSNVFWHLLLAEIFNSQISAGTYQGQHVATLVWRVANRCAPYIGRRGRDATLFKRLSRDDVFGAVIVIVHGDCKDPCHGQARTHRRRASRRLARRLLRRKLAPLLLHP